MKTRFFSLPYFLTFSWLGITKTSKVTNTESIIAGAKTVALSSKPMNLMTRSQLIQLYRPRTCWAIFWSSGLARRRQAYIQTLAREIIKTMIP